MRSMVERETRGWTASHSALTDRMNLALWP
jgi:hypothetical protein